MSKSFCERLVESFESRPDKTAMRIVGSEREVHTYGQLLQQMRSVAYRLREEKVEFGDRVALIGENHPSWASAYLGTVYSGAVIVPLDPHGEIETITNFLENSEAKVAFLSPDQTERFGQIEEKLGRHIPAVVWQDSSPQRRGDTENTNGSVSASQRLSGSNNGFQSFDDWAATKFPDSFAAE